MKKVSLFVLLSVMIIMTFTGCLFMEKDAKLEILGEAKVPFGSSQQFEVKIVSSSAGGVGDVFAKDAEVKSVKWTFKNKTHPEGSFSETKSGDTGRKISPSFTTAPGDYELTVAVTTMGDKLHSAKYNFKVEKYEPSINVTAKMADSQINWNAIEKNDTVDMFITIQDSQLSAEQLNNYTVKWKIAYNGKIDTSTAEKYGTTKKFTYKFDEKAAYTVSAELTGPFGTVYNKSVSSFTISTAKPVKPVLVGTPSWTADGRSFEIEVQAGEDALYYELMKKSSESDLYFFVYRAFVDSKATVKLYDSGVIGDEATYKIYGVDGGQSAGTPLIATFDIPNRPPSKAVVTSPLADVTSVDYEKALPMAWTNGTDFDLGDVVRYDAFIGDSKNSVNRFLGTTSNTEMPITTKQLVSGQTYYLRVDAFDTENKTTGDVHSFTFEPQTVMPVVTSARLDTTKNPHILDNLNILDGNATVIPTNYTRTYEIELSRYATFNDPKKFKITKLATFNGPIQVPTYVYDGNGKMFVRVRITYENIHMKVITDWSSPAAVALITAR